MTHVTATIGDGKLPAGTFNEDNNLNWPDNGTVYMTVPAGLSASGVAIELRRFVLESQSNFAVLRISLATPGTAAGDAGGAGQDLTAAWEGFNPAAVLQAGGLRLEIPGSNVSGIAYILSDSTEPYVYGITDGGFRARVRAFVTAYLALSQSERNATTLTLTDEALTDLGVSASAGAATAAADIAAPRLSVEASAGAAAARLALRGPLRVAADTGTAGAAADIAAPRLSVEASAGAAAAFVELRPTLQILADAGAAAAAVNLAGALRVAAAAGAPEAAVNLRGFNVEVFATAGVPSVSAVIRALRETWPEDLPSMALPSAFLRRGYRSAPADRVTRFRPAEGRALTRPRFTGSFRLVQGTLRLSPDQWQALVRFYDEQLLSGAVPFFFPNPEDGGATVVNARMTAPPQRVRYQADWDVTLTLRLG